MTMTGTKKMGATKKGGKEEEKEEEEDEFEVVPPKYTFERE